MASIKIISPVAEQRVRGVVDIRVQVSGGTSVTAVGIVIGAPAYGLRTATPVGGGEWSVRWDTTRKLADPDVAPPADALFWISATAQVDGVAVASAVVPVITSNFAQSAAAARSAGGGWRKELAWAADYSSPERWRAGQGAVIGAAHASLEDDPVLGAARRVVRASVPNSAKNDADQPNRTTVRFQSSSPRRIREGDELCVGFAFMPASDFPTVYPKGDPTNPAGDPASGYVSLFQIYGPPYDQGSPFVLHAERRVLDDPLDEFAVRGNELNPGDPVPLLSIPYRRGRWTDVVVRMRASASIESGWVELHVNQGESTGVRPLLQGGRAVRLPRVLLRPDSDGFRTDMQVYRVADRIERVTVFHTGHKIARTVAEADPRSYRNGVSA